jgi:hypothetical protein
MGQRVRLLATVAAVVALVARGTSTSLVAGARK